MEHTNIDDSPLPPPFLGSAFEGPPKEEVRLRSWCWVDVVEGDSQVPILGIQRLAQCSSYGICQSPSERSASYQSTSEEHQQQLQCRGYFPNEICSAMVSYCQILPCPAFGPILWKAVVHALSNPWRKVQRKKCHGMLASGAVSPSSQQHHPEGWYHWRAEQFEEGAWGDTTWPADAAVLMPVGSAPHQSFGTHNSMSCY